MPVSQAMATRDLGAIAEKVIAEGDLSQLSQAERTEHYLRTCESLGLNWRTRPLEYLKFQGKVILYARKDCTDQLRRIHRISLRILSREQVGDVYVVTVQATMPDGREDESTGAVYIKGLSGENLANAYLRCETKAKRRATLSIAGLGLLDETEVDTLPRIHASATLPREDVPPKKNGNGPHAALAQSDGPPEESAEQSAMRDTLMHGILETLKTVPDAEKPRRRQLLQEAFGCGWSGMGKLTLPQLQVGYAHLQELMHPALVDADDVPDLGGAGEVSSHEAPDYATPTQIAELKALARDAGDEAYADVQDLLEHTHERIPLDNYETIKARLEQGNQAKTRVSGTEGAP